MDDLLQVGAITSTHGIRGEVKVFPMTDDVNRFLDLKHVLLDTGNGQRKLTITRVKFFKNLVILKFQDYDTIEAVEQWKGKPLYVSREDAVACEEGEYFIADLIGIQAQTEEGEVLGAVSDVLLTGANDVYVIRDAQGSELLVPAIKECILNIDLEAEKMIVHLMPGLRD